MWAEVEEPNLSLVGGSRRGGDSILFAEGEKKKKGGGGQKKTGMVLHYRSDPTGRITFLLLDEIDSCDYSGPTSPPPAAPNPLA